MKFARKNFHLKRYQYLYTGIFLKKGKQMIIGGLQKTSFLDYPDKISTIIFTSGCNFRCGYCHNPELINSKTSKYSTEEIIQFLKTRTGKSNE